MHTNEYRFIFVPRPLEQSYVLQSIGFLTERYESEVSVFGRHIHFYTLFYDGFLFEAVGYQIFDGNDLQSKTLGDLP